MDLFKLQPASEHPHGLTDADYDMLFTKDKPVPVSYTHLDVYKRQSGRNA